MSTDRYTAEATKAVDDLNTAAAAIKSARHALFSLPQSAEIKWARRELFEVAGSIRAALDVAKEV